MVIDGRYPANQSRLVVSPMIYKVYKQYIATSLDHFLKDMGAQVFVFRGFCFLWLGGELLLFNSGEGVLYQRASTIK